MRNHLFTFSTVLLGACTPQDGSVPAGFRVVWGDSPIQRVDTPKVASCSRLGSISYNDSIGQAEQKLLANFRHVVARSGETLFIVPLTMDTIRLVDCPGVGFEHTRFVFEGIMRELDAFLVHDMAGEGDFYILISSKTGQQLHLSGRPLPSPDGARFVVASLDLYAEFNPNELRVFRVGPDSVRLEWSWRLGDDGSNESWGPTEPTWNGNQEIRFTKVIQAADLSPENERRIPMMLRLASDGWRMATDTMR